MLLIEDTLDQREGSRPLADVVPRSAAAQAYDARRCAICGARYPAFGFVPPVIPKGETWACGAHRAEVENRLGALARSAAEHEKQLAFL